MERTSNAVGAGHYCDGYDGHIAELLLYERELSVPELADVHTYLQGRWQCCS